MDKRTLLAITLSFLLIMGYQHFFVKKPVPSQQAPASVQETESIAAGSETQIATKTTASLPRSLVKTDNAGDVGEDITVETPLYIAVFNTKGAALKSFELKNYKTDLSKNSKPVELVSLNKNMNYPLSLSFPKSSVNIAPNVIYEADKTSVNLIRKMNVQKLTFSRSYPGEIEIERIYTFYPEKYSFDLNVNVRNLSKDIIKESALLSWNQYVDPEAKTGRYSHEGPISYVKEKIHREKVKKLGAPKFLGPDVSWGGFESKYFIVAPIPQQPSLTNLVISKDSENVVSVSLGGPKNIILPGQSGTFKYNIYIGPKDYDILKSEEVGLENSIDFGSWIKWLALPLLIALNFIYQYIHNYGIAIIILTLLVKIIFWPLGNISYKSMKGMQQLQPKMTEIREKYKDDKQRINQETMALYKTYKINPMSGCLPMLIQLPVFFGLYRALLYAIELRHSPFFFWIQDLSAKDPYYITPIIMGATMFLQQKMSPQPGGNEMQAKLMMLMPVIFTFMFLNFPSGLVIYWLFNNILSIGQQYYINKQNS